MMMTLTRMKKTVRLVSLILWLLPAWPTLAAAPNVVIFIADDQGMGDLSCYGPADVTVPPYLPDHPLIREEIAQYYNEIARFDRHVGQVLDELSNQKLLNQTFIVYVSDNGMPFPRAKTL